MNAYRRILVITGTALLLTVTGCAANAPAGPQLTTDERAAADVALEKAGATNAKEKVELLDVYEWRNGYSVLVLSTGTNSDGKYTNYQAYGLVPEGDSWSIENYNTIEDDLDPARHPARATCLTLAEDQTEHDACLAIAE